MVDSRTYAPIVSESPPLRGWHGHSEKDSETFRKSFVGVNPHDLSEMAGLMLKG